MRLIDDQKGAVLLFSVLVIGTAIFVAFLALSQAGINSFVDASDQGNAMNVRAKLYGCADETLIQLSKDSAYAPATVVTGAATCNLTVTTPASGERNFDVTLTEGSISRGVHMEVTLDPFTVTDVSDQ